MRLFMLLSVYYLATLGSDIAKVYPPGSEKAVAGGGLAVVAVNGKELASGRQQRPGDRRGIRQGEVQVIR